MLGRRLLLIASAAAALALPAPASAVVNGSPAARGAYPAHGFLGIDSDGNGFVNSFCGGTLVGSRQFLTAARCTTNTLGQARLPSRLTVRIGDINLPDSTVLQNVAENDIPDPSEIPPDGYVRPTGKNDLAMLTLKAPVDGEPVRVVEDTEDALWAPGIVGSVLGWGETSHDGDISETLLEGAVTVRPDRECGAGFDATVMLCAAGAEQNPCASDSGSPLLVPDGGLLAVAGVFSGTSCSTPGDPGVFARIGGNPLNEWVHNRTPEADFDLSHQPRVDEPVRLFSISRHPEGAGYFTTFRWDLDNDGAFDDATGASISRTYRQAGEAVAGLEASKPGGDKAVIYYAFDVEPRPGTVTPGGQTTTPTPVGDGVTGTTPGPLATILVSGRPKVRRGRFPIRIRFARTAPSGTAVIEVYRGTRRIGIARTKVRRGATKRVRVKLTTTGRRILRRAESRRLRIRVRVRVGSRLLRSRRVTIRR